MIKFTIENKDFILEQANKSNTYMELLKVLGYSSDKCKPKLEKFLLENSFDTSKFINAKLVGKIEIIEKNKEKIIKIAKNFNQMTALGIALGWKKGHKNKKIGEFLKVHAPEILNQYNNFLKIKGGIPLNKENHNVILDIAKKSENFSDLLRKLNWYPNPRNREKLRNYLLSLNFDISNFDRIFFKEVINSISQEELLKLIQQFKSLNKLLIHFNFPNNTDYRAKLSNYLKKLNVDFHIFEEYSHFDLTNYKTQEFLIPLEIPLKIIDENKDKIIQIASKSSSIRHLNILLGYKNHNNDQYTYIKNFLIEHNFDFSLFKRENLERKSDSIFSDKKRLQEIVNKSINYAQILKNYNLSTSGDQVDNLKKYLAYHEINIKHFRLKNKEKEKVFYTNEEMFIPNSQVDKTTICRKILEQNLISYSCSHCDIGHMWFNQELILDLEHIDGNNKNQLLSNLTFLCPNCHRKTLTWGGRNTKKEKIEPNFIKAHDLNQIIKEKYAYAQVLAHYQDKNNKYNIQKIRQYVIDNKIDISHFKFVKEGIKKQLDMNIFSTNSKIESNKIKEVILKHNLISYQCITKNCPTHHDNHSLLSLDLDHTNGDKTDNRLENLRFLCPNCHRITLNWGNKKR